MARFRLRFWCLRMLWSPECHRSCPRPGVGVGVRSGVIPSEGLRLSLGGGEEPTQIPIVFAVDLLDGMKRVDLARMSVTSMSDGNLEVSSGHMVCRFVLSGRCGQRICRQQGDDDGRCPVHGCCGGFGVWCLKKYCSNQWPKQKGTRYVLKIGGRECGCRRIASRRRGV